MVIKKKARTHSNYTKNTAYNDDSHTSSDVNHNTSFLKSPIAAITNFFHKDKSGSNNSLSNNSSDKLAVRPKHAHEPTHYQSQHDQNQHQHQFQSLQSQNQPQTSMIVFEDPRKKAEERIKRNLRQRV